MGYVATGLKNVREAQVGDTVTTVANPAAEPLPGYQEAKSLVFAGIYPVSGEDYPLLRDAIEKLHLNDASFTFEPIAAWMGISNIWRGISCLSRSVKTRPTDWAL